MYICSYTWSYVAGAKGNLLCSGNMWQVFKYSQHTLCLCCAASEESEQQLNKRKIKQKGKQLGKSWLPIICSNIPVHSHNKLKCWPTFELWANIDRLSIKMEMFKFLPASKQAMKRLPSFWAVRRLLSAVCTEAWASAGSGGVNSCISMLIFFFFITFELWPNLFGYQFREHSLSSLRLPGLPC